MGSKGVIQLSIPRDKNNPRKLHAAISSVNLKFRDISSSTKFDEDYYNWAWSVESDNAGLHFFLITIDGLLLFDGEETPLGLATLNRAILVQGNFLGLASNFLNRNFSWFFSGLIISIFMAALVVSRISFGTLVKKQEKKISAVIEKETNESLEETPQNLKSAIENELNLLLEKEKLSMLSTKQKSNTLFIISTLFMVLSVFSPILSFSIYVSLEPITDSMISALERIKSIGPSVSFDSVSSTRDWRIIAGGVSLGLLFLAAARGLVRQESYMRRMYLIFASKIAELESLLAVVRISNKFCNSRNINKDEELTSLILSKLIAPRNLNCFDYQPDELKEELMESNLYEKLKKLTNIK
ncbi:hypothetical protein [Aliikangiella coralliicola]|uniref:Uncharacterized protein n=1 Tax=Aliikangiella coralliicola TaxID=2592383 RepID=A0A545TSQ5_9GAMM|nr:hypothetical protein [Aliikangiella coralliicola]TQV80247.1 hypothetical protein FLL46_26375 [Aliikangiella coralliicola]